MSENKIRRNRLLLANILVIIILIFTPSGGKVKVEHLDKVVHFSLFLMLAINACYRYQKAEQRVDALIWSILFGLTTEVFQQCIPGRVMDMYDGIANTLGIISGYYIYRRYSPPLDKIILTLGA